MEDKKILYLVYWDNGKWVGGYEKHDDNYKQVFNNPIDFGYLGKQLKKYKTIKILTQAEFAKMHKICFLADYLRNEGIN